MGMTRDWVNTPPSTIFFSMRRVDDPILAAVMAAETPAIPPPITTTSYCLFI
jgi:hypothetical protein